MSNLMVIISGTAVFFAAMALRGIFGYLKNKKVADIKWDWGRFIRGSFDPIAKIIGVSLLAVLMTVFISLVDQSGVDIAGIDQVSPEVLVVGILIADVAAIGAAIKEALSAVFGLSENQINQIQEVAAAKASDEDLGLKIEYKDSKIVAFANAVKQDAGTGETLDAVEVPQMGAFPYYKVDVSSPKAFVSAVTGRGFDEGYGNQCVSGWKEYTYSLCGQIVATSSGGASGYANQASQIVPMGFTHIVNKNDIRDGDWVVFGMNTVWGHIAMKYGDKFFGQNQGGANGVFNLTGVSLDTYLCHYRPNIYKEIAPQPTPPAGKKPIDDALISAVIRGDYGNGADRTKNLTNAGYDAAEVQRQVNARLTGSAVPTNPTKVSIGDRVRVNAAFDVQTLAPLNQAVMNDGNSYYAGQNTRGNAVVSFGSAGGAVRAAVNYNDLSRL